MTTPLTPAAQAVLDACNDAVERLPLISTKPEQFSIALIAASLRAAADQVAPETPPSQLGDPEILVGIWGERRIIREDLLSIATELEAQ